MSEETLVRPADEDGYIIAWRAKYQFETGQLDGEMTYGEATQKCAELCAKEPGKTFWPQRVASAEASYGKFHKAH